MSISIKNDFENYDSLIQEKQNIIEEIENIRNKLTDIKKLSQKDPFVFLQQSNTIDVYQKKQRLMKIRSEEIVKELEQFPMKIHKKLSNAVLNYFNKKEADETKKLIEKEKQDRFYKGIEFGLNGLFLIGALLFTMKLIRSRK